MAAAASSKIRRLGPLNEATIGRTNEARQMVHDYGIAALVGETLIA
jgi:hypothetical protein